jgi:hypothetical protein
MNKENLAIGIALSGVIVSTFAWLMPFLPTRTSPAEIVLQQPAPAIPQPGTVSTPYVENTTTFATETTATSMVYTGATETTTDPGYASTDSSVTTTESQPVTAPASHASILPWGGATSIEMSSKAAGVAASDPSSAATLTESGDDRWRWTHSEGSFVDATGGKWLEKRANGTVAFRFREVSRNAQAIELHDTARDCYVRLTASTCHVKCMWWPQQGYPLEWAFHYNGAWR